MVFSPTGMPDCGTTKRTALLVVVWTFVLALLFGAVAPLGPPDTLVHGPAFNPATTSVAITTKRGENGTALSQRVGGMRHDGGPIGGVALPTGFTFAIALVLLVLLHACTPGPVLRPVRRGAQHARAPPQACRPTP